MVVELADLVWLVVEAGQQQVGLGLAHQALLPLGVLQGQGRHLHGLGDVIQRVADLRGTGQELPKTSGWNGGARAVSVGHPGDALIELLGR